MAPLLSSALAVDILADGLHRFADVVCTPMPDVAARLETSGPRPVLHLDSDSPSEVQCRVMMETLLALAFGPDAAVTARRVRRLHSVS